MADVETENDTACCAASVLYELRLFLTQVQQTFIPNGPGMPVGNKSSSSSTSSTSSTELEAVESSEKILPVFIYDGCQMGLSLLLDMLLSECRRIERKLDPSASAIALSIASIPTFVEHVIRLNNLIDMEGTVIDKLIVKFSELCHNEEFKFL